MGALREVIAAPIGQLGDGQRDVRAVTVSTFESALRHMDRLGDRFEMLVVDEAHHFGSGKKVEALEMSTAPFRIGLTATPPDTDGETRQLEAVIGPIVMRRSVVDLAGTHLAAFEHLRTYVDLTPTERAEYEALYRPFRQTYRELRAAGLAPTWGAFMQAASATVEGRRALQGFHAARRLVGVAKRKLDAVANLLARHAKDRVLVFCASNAGAYSISRRHLVPAITKDIGRKEREAVLERFRGGGSAPWSRRACSMRGSMSPRSGSGSSLAGSWGRGSTCSASAGSSGPDPARRRSCTSSWFATRSRWASPTSGGAALLPNSELPVVVRDGRVLPQWVFTRDHRWIEKLLDRLAALDGARHDDLDIALRERPELGETQRSWRAAVRLATGLGKFETVAAAPPVIVRAAVFDAAAGQVGSAREAVLRQVAAGFSVTPDDLERSLYADLPGERVFRLPANIPSAAEFANRLNLAIGQSILRRAESLRVRVVENLEAILRMARLTRLLCWATEDRNGRPGAILGVSGPLSLFRRTTVYGRAMASWLPVLARTRGWSLMARCEIGGERGRWHADHRDPLVAGDTLLRRFDSRVEERLFRDLAKVAPELEVLREATVVRAADRLVSPDFVLRCRRTGRMVSVEVVGFWTPRYLDHKIEALRSIADRTSWILCIDDTLALADCELPSWPILPFRRRIDAEALVELAKGHLEPQCGHARAEATR